MSIELNNDRQELQSIADSLLKSNISFGESQKIYREWSIKDAESYDKASIIQNVPKWTQGLGPLVYVN